MKESAHILARHSEHGGARVKLLIVAVVIILVANASYQFIPVAYQSESFKQDMHTAIVQGISLPSTYGKPNELITSKITNAARVNDLPSDTYIEVLEKNKVITARVFYRRAVPLIPFGVWNYDFVFDHTATPGGFLSEEN